MADLQIKEMLEEIVRGMVDEKTVNEILEKEIRDKLECKYDYEIKKVAQKIIKEKANSFIEDYVKECLKKGVRIDNGWGSKETYTTFEDFVRENIKKEFDSKWEVQRTIEKYTSERVKTVCKKIMEENLKPCVDKAIEELAGKGE
jgi:DNA-binding FrmR family transcriptional regulator